MLYILFPSPFQAGSSDLMKSWQIEGSELPDKEPAEYLPGFHKQLPHWQADGHFRLRMSEVL